MQSSWYKNAVIYALDVKVFCDSNGDGIGDIPGLIGKLDYLESIGVTCIWLLPIYPSPKVDDGYDVKDYYNVDDSLGDLGDFVKLIDEARQRGMRIIMDMVANHTSIEHPWFKASKSSRNSPYRNYYVWDDDPNESQEKVMFEEAEDSIWEYSEETDSYYLHRYFKQQADLNIANPDVRNEILKAMGFWLKLGVSGFRIDAAHVISDPVEVEHIDFGNLHKFFGSMRDFIDQKDPDAVLLGEASVPPKEIERYFKSDNENPRMHMLFNFLANKHTFLAFARQSGRSLTKGLKLYKDVGLSHWVNFIRHHDELNLELLDAEERKEVWRSFAPEEDMRLFGHGIRRRLPAMLKGNLNKLKLFYVINFSLPGTPLITYGEEIMMGDDLSLPGRESVRTPMQWSAEPNAGFSSAAKDELYRPVIDHGDYSYEKLNVMDQQRDPDSFLNWLCTLVRMRKQNPIIGTGNWEIMNPLDERLSAWYFKQDASCLVVICNLSREEVSAQIVADIKPGKMIDVYSDSKYDEEIDLNKLKLRPFGFRWIQILDKEDFNYINK